jgi:hypothetical protein
MKMTKEETLAMQPGRALDVLVAERVMGHPMPTSTPEDAVDLYLSGAPVHQDGWTCVFRYDEGDEPKWIPGPYSTDIAAAWQVVEAIRNMKDEKGNPVICCLTIKSDHNYVWDIEWSYSELSSRNDGHKTHALPYSCEELPEAICKAALVIWRLVKDEEENG